MLPRILLVSCGGTISSGAERIGGPVAPASSALDLVAMVPGLPELAVLDTAVHSLVPSSFTTLQDVLDLYARIRRLLATAAADEIPYAGVVVTHGTDTMEEVAFALDLFWRDEDVPLVLTGAMRNASLPGTDGPANLLSAVATAASAQARGLGVLVVLNDVVHAARLVRKTHTSNVATFESPSVGPLGLVTERRVSVVLAPRSRATLPEPPPVVDAAAIALVKVCLGDDARALAAAAAPGCTGLVIEAMGGGHLPPAVADSSEFASLVRRLPVVIASRTGAGSMLVGTYDFVGSEIWLRERGVIFSGLLDGLKSRILLAVLLARPGSDRRALAHAFAAIELGATEASSALGSGRAGGDLVPDRRPV